MEKMILFYVEFDNGDSNCYQGDRVPTLDEARAFCKVHIDGNDEWQDVASVYEIDKERAMGLWDLSRHEDEGWPVFSSKAKKKH